MANNIFNQVFENALTVEQINNTFSKAIDELIAAKSERMKLVKSGKAKPATTKAAEKKAEPKTTKKTETKTSAKAKKSEELGKDAAVIFAEKNGVKTVKIDKEIAKKLKLNYQEHDEKRFWIFGDTKPITSFLMGCKARFYDAKHSQCKDSKGNAVDAWILYKKSKDGKNVEAQFKKAFSL